MAVIRVLVADQAIPEAEPYAALHSQREIVVVGAVKGEYLVDMDLRELKPDVLILRLVDATGLELLRSIHSAHGWLRILVASSQTDPDFLYRILQAGAGGLVSYRATGEALGDAVRAVHAGGILISRDLSTALLSGYLDLGGGMGKRWPLQRLSRRERQVLDLVLEGKTSNEIALDLAISPKSVGTYRGRLMSKFGVSNLPGLLHFATENGWISR